MTQEKTKTPAGVDLVYTDRGMLRVWCHRCHRDVAVLHVARAALRGDAA